MVTLAGFSGGRLPFALLFAHDAEAVAGDPGVGGVAEGIGEGGEHDQERGGGQGDGERGGESGEDEESGGEGGGEVGGGGPEGHAFDGTPAAVFGGAVEEDDGAHALGGGSPLEVAEPVEAFAEAFGAVAETAAGVVQDRCFLHRVPL